MLLPLGSIVKMKEGKEKLMIICRLPLFNNSGTIGYFDYSACLYPFGQADQNMIFFNEEDIDQVLFTGYKDKDEEKFQKIVDESMDTINYPRLQLEIGGNDGKGK